MFNDYYKPTEIYYSTSKFWPLLRASVFSRLNTWKQGAAHTHPVHFSFAAPQT
jgi:hypothetical protein